MKIPILAAKAKLQISEKIQKIIFLAFYQSQKERG